MFVVAAISFADGSVLHGPFNSYDEALCWAEQELNYGNWEIVPIERTDDEN